MFDGVPVCCGLQKFLLLAGGGCGEGSQASKPKEDLLSLRMCASGSVFVDQLLKSSYPVLLPPCITEQEEGRLNNNYYLSRTVIKQFTCIV